MKAVNPMPWTEGMRLALEKARMRLKTNKRIAEETGADASVIGKCLNKDSGWINARTYQHLLALEEFAELEEDRQKMLKSDWFQLSENEKLLISALRELSELEQARTIIDVFKRLRMRQINIKPE